MKKLLAQALIAVSLGGITGPYLPEIRMETNFLAKQFKDNVAAKNNPINELPPSVPVVYDPLVAPDGAEIVPVNTAFSLIIPKIGVNAPVVANVDPANPGEYDLALKEGVAHSKSSFFPDENGTVYLFSHSTNYQWFVKDLNAVFYLLKNLEISDTVVVNYRDKRYTYVITDKKIVKPNEINYLIPQQGERKLILETCWPPGSTFERLLLFADLTQII